jgi:DNA polymerase I-like protein with 3'-5' exonuclease and polymerase domains
VDRYLKRLLESDTIFVDTETDEFGKLWSLQTSIAPGTGAFISRDQPRLLDAVSKHIAQPSILTVGHNMPFDVPVMKQIGAIPSKYADTMQMAYLLQSEPQGLKALAYRHAGMQMSSFTDITADATRRKALLYLAQAVEQEWSDPNPVLEFPTKGPKAGGVHVRHPQNISKKIYGILRDSTTVAIDKKTHRLADEEEGVNPLKRWYDIDPEDGRSIVEEKMGQMQRGYLQDIDPEIATRYANMDADATSRIYPILWSQIQSLGLEEAFWTDMEAMPICLDMMECGIQVDKDYLRSLDSFFETKLNKINTEITQLSGGVSINPRSPEQISNLLFKKLKLKTIKRFNAKGFHPTGDEILAQLVVEHPVVQKIRDYKEYAKFRSTYTEQIPRWAEADGRVHPTIKMTRTSTGRLAMSDPNLQNIPVRKEDSRKIRNGFVAQPGCSLVAIDLSQIELRCFAHFSQDPELLEVYRNGGDIHTKTGCRFFNCTPEELPEYPERRSAKTGNFGIVYDITARGLYERMLKDDITGWTVDDCQEFINSWLTLYSGVVDYRKEIHNQARRFGYVRGIGGRIRYIPGVRCKDRYLVAEALRQAANFPIQWAAAYILKKAMKDIPEIYTYYRSRGYVCNPLLQVHDELIFEIQDELIPSVVPILKGIMEHAVPLSVPTPADAKDGVRWGELERMEV